MKINIHVAFHFFASSPVQDHTESVDQQAKDFVDGKHFNSVAISEKRDTLLARYGAIHVSHCYGCDRSLLLLERHKIKTWSDDLMRMIGQCPRARFSSLFHSLVPTRFMPHRDEPLNINDWRIHSKKSPVRKGCETNEFSCDKSMIWCTLSTIVFCYFASTPAW